MNRIEPNFTQSTFFSPGFEPEPSLPVEKTGVQWVPPTKAAAKHPAANPGEHPRDSTPCIFTIMPPAGADRWRCLFSRDGAPPVEFIPSVFNFSSLAMLLLEALRRLDDDMDTSLEVKDSSGEWLHWLTVSPRSGPNLKLNIPAHILN